MIWFLAMLAALTAVLVLRCVVPRLPLPEAEPDDPIPDYPALATPLNLTVVAILGAATTLIVGPGRWHSLVWLGYLGVGGALVWVDARTTYLPRRLNDIATAVVVAGLAVLALHDWRAALGGLVAGVLCRALFHLVWRFSSQFGFGDVRLAGLVGAAAGTLGASSVTVALVAGTMIAAIWGIVHKLTRRDAPVYFPYGPGLWLGPVVAAALTRW